MLLTRSLFSATEPTHCLRCGERIVGVIEQGDTMTEYILGRDVPTRRDILRLMDVVIASGMFPPATRAFAPVRRKRTSKHDAHGRQRKRRR